jgi:hypothetical protein
MTWTQETLTLDAGPWPTLCWRHKYRLLVETSSYVSDSEIVAYSESVSEFAQALPPYISPFSHLFVRLLDSGMV